MGDASDKITGGCLCGAVRYEASEPPQRTLYCHCRMCQKAGGGPFKVSAFFRSDAVHFTRGRAKLYQSSDIAERGFCEICGSQLIFQMVGSALMGIDIGTLDHPEDVSPAYHTGVESQVSWLNIDDDLPRMRTDDNPNLHALKAAADQDVD